MYSKNGSIPKPETDGTEGWVEVPDEPDCPEGKEVIWWYPPGWIIRDPQPAGNWSWSQSTEQWVEIVTAQVTEQIQSLATEQIVAMETSQISGLNG
jgi:hypothetical protein